MASGSNFRTHGKWAYDAEQKERSAFLRDLGFSRGQVRHLVNTKEQNELKRLVNSKANGKWRRGVNPRRAMLRRKKASAKLNGRDFTIKESDLEWPTHCPIFGVELHYPGRFSGDSAAAS